MTPRWALWNTETNTWDEVSAENAPGEWHGGHEYGDPRSEDAAPLDVERLAMAIRMNGYEIRPYRGEWMRPADAAAAIAREYAALLAPDPLNRTCRAGPDGTWCATHDARWTTGTNRCVRSGWAPAASPSDDAAPLDVERLALAIAMTKGMEPGETVETTKGDVSVLDYPDEWFDTPRDLAEDFAREYAALATPAPKEADRG